MNSVQGTTNTLMLGKVRIAGVLCTVGGVGWLVNGVLSSVISQSSVMVLAIADVFWIGIQSLLLIGVVGLALSGVAPGWFGGVSQYSSARAGGLRSGGDPRTHQCTPHRRGYFDSTAARRANYGSGHDARRCRGTSCEALERLAEVHTTCCEYLPLRGDVPLHIHHRRTKHTSDCGLGINVVAAGLRDVVEHCRGASFTEGELGFRENPPSWQLGE
jgi:hypothetical protein